MSAAPIPQGIERLDPNNDGIMEPYSLGEYVSYDDHAAALAASEANVAMFKQAAIDASNALAAERIRAEAAEQALTEGMRTAETLCRIYFEIAAECIGEDAVRQKRDAAIDAMPPKEDKP